MRQWIIIYTLYCLTSLTWGQNGFELLLRNQPQQALENFRKETQDINPQKKARALRGMGLVNEYLGYSTSATHYYLEAFLTDRDPDHLLVNMNAMLGSLRRADTALQSRWLQAMELLDSLHPTHPVRSELREELGSYFITSFTPEQMRAYHQKEAPVREWKMVGPFDNVSGSGALRAQPPENGFHFKERYTGMSGLQIGWTDLQINSHNGWTMLDQRQGMSNALNYFATTLNSPDSGTAMIHFGVSGVFTLWFNGERIAYSDVFQNTGREGYRIQVPLRKGANSVLLKLGHEENYFSNFILRISDLRGQPLNLPAKPAGQKKITHDSGRSHILEPELVTRFSDDIAQSRNVPEARIQLARYYVSHENFLLAKQRLQELERLYPSSAWVASLSANLYAREGNTTLATFQYERIHRLDSLNGEGWSYAYRQRINQKSWQEALQMFQNRPRLLQLSNDQIVNHIVSSYRLSRQQEMQEWLDSLLNRSDVEAQLQAAEILAELGNQELALNLVEQSMHRALVSSGLLLQIADRLRTAARSQEAYALLYKGLEYYPDRIDLIIRLADYSFQDKDYVRTEKTARQALLLNPLHTGLYKLLGKSQEMQGRLPEALKSYQKVLDIGRNDFELSDHVRSLQKQKTLAESAHAWNLLQLAKEGKNWKEGRTENSLVLLSQRSLLAHAWGGYEIRDRLLVEVLDPQGVDDWKEYEVSYESNYEQLRIVRAVSIKPDGKTLPADMNKTQLVFATLAPGDLIEVIVARQFSFPGQIAGQFWARHMFQSRVPILVSQFEILTPLDKQYQVRQHRIQLPANRKRESNQAVQTFEARKIQPRPPESAMPPWSDALAWIQISSVAHWGFIADWFHGLTEGKSIPTPELRSFADSLFTGATDDAEKMRRVHDFIVSDIRYSYMSFRQSGFIPQSAARTLATRMGDCKDMATLARTLLALGGVSSDLVLVNTNDDGRAAILPTVEFNHCILRSHSGIYVDYTATHNGWQSLPRSDQGARALVATQELGDSLRWLPWSSSETEYTWRDSQDTLFADGTLARDMTTRRGGNFAALMRGWYRFQNPEKVRLDVLRSIQKWHPGAELSYNHIEGLDSLDQEVVHRYVFRSRLSGWVSGKTLCLPVPWSDDITAASLPGEPTRHYNYEFWRNWTFFGRYRQSIRLVLPEGWSLLDIPQTREITGEFGSYKITYKLTGNILEAARYFEPRIQDVEPARYVSFRAQLEELLRADRTMLVLVRD